MKIIPVRPLLMFCLIFTFFCQGMKDRGFTVARETQLRNDLFGNYSAKIRPDGVTRVNVVFNLLTINDLETRTQTLSVSGFFLVVWVDSRLVWNTSDYGDIGFFFSDETEVWRPALVVKNAVNDISVIANKDVPFRITDKGRVFWTPPGIYKTNCDIDTTYYPFDTQTCSVVVQSWGYNLRELNLGKFGTGVETNEFQKNGEWDLLNATSKRAERVDRVDANTYATVTFDFILKRRPTYYGLNVILPVVVLSVLSGLVFVLPADSGEKMGYSLTVLLAFAVFLTLISDRMPTTSKNTSYMGVYLSLVLCLSGLSVLLTIVILGLYFREDPVSGCVGSIAKKLLVPLVCETNCHRQLRAPRISNSDPVEEIKLPNRAQKIPKKTKHDSALWSEKRRRDALTVVRSLTDEEELTWKDIARHVDKLCFRLYMVAIVLVTVVFFAILGANI